MSDANGDTTRWEYDGLGRLRAVIDPLGNVTTYAHDRLDRVIAEWVVHNGDPVGTAVPTRRHGKRAERDRPAGTRPRSCRYDTLGRRTEEVWYATIADAQGAGERRNTIAWSYDAVGRVTAVRDRASSYHYTYDELDRPLVTSMEIAATPPVALP